jgi:hypothetical protein
MLLKIIEESGKVILVAGITTLFGAIGGIGYLFKSGFGCAVDHFDPGVSIDFSKINYTQVFQYFFNRNGTLSIPIEIHPSIDATSCVTPVIVGAAIGVGAGGLFLASHYSRRYRDQQQAKRNQIHDFTEDSPRQSLLPV